VTEAVQRSNGNITFPYSKQEGFVWFANRIYHGKGQVFDDPDARLWMKKGLVEMNAPEVNYITAVSDKNLWIILNNEATSDKQITVKVNREEGMDLSLSATLYTEDGTKNNKEEEEGIYQVVLPTKGLRALAIPLLAFSTPALQKPLKEGMQVVDLGKEFGKAYLFRIRSPFGWDSIYCYAESGPLKNASLRIVCNRQEKEVNEYPFESSFYKLTVDQPIRIEVSGSVNGKSTGTGEVDFN